LAGSHVIADDLTAAEVFGAVLGSATAEVTIDASLIDLGSNLTLGAGSRLQMGLSGSTRATGSGGSQYAAIDAAFATLGGTLAVALVNGYTPVAGESFLLIDAPTIVGSFSSVTLPDLPGALAWEIDASATSYRLNVVGADVAGDYNQDGIVNVTDYTVWRNTLGSIDNLAADGNHNRVVDAGDYTVWKSHFGQTASLGTSVLSSAVPEPATLAMTLGLMAWLLVGSRVTRVEA
jgi:hypothetical protein